MRGPAPPRATNTNPSSPLLYRVHAAVRGEGEDVSTTYESKQGRSKNLPQGRTYSGVSVGGIPSKGVDNPQPNLTGETDEAGSTHVGVQNDPGRADMDHPSNYPQMKFGHPVGRYY